ncbi:DUF3500 domain-containing protein [Lignipirellula cremea]|uniref:DUF3500 domain-containing protein n=1 Tax=Lignipirellula cremea TaxID=2528010 RepID=A0A518DVA0_9BACT|nr:DUF3500 domain-containing protein [Lignipirellula cremea]QDU95758.1 hypothetical protein Pla8534_35750 [Lignipirellula cremea]
MKRVLILILSVALLGAGATGWSHWKETLTGTAVTEAATAFAGTLTDEQKQTVMQPYESPTRLEWHFIPKAERKGLQVKHMDAAQKKAAHLLLSNCLSKAGYRKATQIMALEKVLAELEAGKKGGNIRDSERYYFTIFGAPGADSTWGLSVEGHHLSLNFVIKGNEVVSSTPTFFASNPAVVMNKVEAAKEGLRVLKLEETLAFDLVGTLTTEQKSAALIAEKAPAEIRGAGEAQPPQDPAEGLAAGKLDAKQAKLLRKLIGVYALNMPADVADARIAAIEHAGFDKVHFAWAGAEKPGVGHYYRIQGPTFLIEFVNVQPDPAGNPANHIHCVWRDMRGDFALSAK